MAVQTGTATGHIDLVNKLVTFLTTDTTLVGLGENWTALRDSAFPFTVTWPGRIAFHGNVGTFATVAPDAPPNGMPATNVKWKATGKLVAPSAGLYSFSLRADEQALIRINGSIVGGQYAPNFANSFTQSFDVTLNSGDNDFEIVFAHSGDTTYGAALGWKKPGDGSFSIVPSANFTGMTSVWGYAETANASQADLLATEADKEVVLRGPGLGGTDEIYVGLRTIGSAQSDSYNVLIRYLTGYSASAQLSAQPGASLPHYLLAWNQATPYWFVASGRRFIVIAKVSTVYSNAYCGFFLPYALPTEMPYPIAVGANGLTNVRWSIQTSENSCFWNPTNNDGVTNNGAVSIRRTDGAQEWFANFSVLGTIWASAGKTYPYANVSSGGGAGGASLINYRPSPDNNYALQPVALSATTNGSNVWGELDGVYHVSGFGNSSESLINIAGTDYLVVQGAHRTSAHDYAAIKLA